MMNLVITILYFNGRVYEETHDVIFEGSKKAIQIKRGISFNALKKIGDKVKLQNNEIISAISCRFLVSGKYIALKFVMTKTLRRCWKVLNNNKKCQF